MNTPLISVIVPAYNCENYIGRCIEKILNQSFEDFELIIIDDGSIDKTFEICRSYLSKDHRIILLKKSNGGVSSARNKGIDIAKGKYISFIDADDYVDSSFLEDFYLEHSENVHLYVQGYKLEIPNVKASLNKINRKGIVNEKEFFDIIFTTGFIMAPWAKLFSSKIIKDNNIRFNENHSYAEDRLFNAHFIQKSNTFALSDKASYHYTQENPDALTKKNYPADKMYAFVKEFSLLVKEMINRGRLSGKAYYAAKEMYLYNFIQSVINLHTNKETDKEVKISFINNLDRDLILEAYEFSKFPLTYKIVAKLLKRISNSILASSILSFYLNLRLSLKKIVLISQS